MEIFHTHISQRSKRLVNQVLESGWINQGPMVSRLENILKKTGYINPITTNSCTSALHLALLAAGIKPGDRVAISPRTFIASGMAILATGAKCCFCDIDPSTGNINPDSIPYNDIQAIMVVHWGGNPVPLTKILSKEIPVIEDAAHALGSYHANGEKIGCLKHDCLFTCFSFQAIKMVTGGDGGFICSPQKYIETISNQRWFGVGKNRQNLASKIGFKYNMNDITASLILGNLPSLKSRILKRKYNVNYLREKLTNLKFVKDTGDSCYWLCTLLVDQRDNFIKAMRDRGIPCSTVDFRIDKHPIFGGEKILPGVEEFEDHQVAIPCHEGLKEEEIANIIESIQKGW